MGEGKHARFTVASDGAHARAVAFGNDGKLGVQAGEPVDATFALEVNEWRGVSEPRLVLRHVQARVEEPVTVPAATQSERPTIEDFEQSPLVPAARPAIAVSRRRSPEPAPPEGELVLF